MVVVSNEPRKRRRFSGRPSIPNGLIRWFVCESAAAMHERGGYGEGFSSHGDPDPLPYKASELGGFEKLDRDGNPDRHGLIERARECRLVWHAIGSEHREELASFYAARTPGCTDGAGMSYLVQAMGLTPAVAKVSANRLEYAGTMMLMAARGSKSLLTDAINAVRVAHEIWDFEFERIDRASDVRWKTGAL